jgi:DNA-binding response OmpR family regulator
MSDRLVAPASQERILFVGRVILIVQRRWLLARSLSSAFEAKGARVLLANNADSGVALADHPHLAAAVLDGQSLQLCRKLGKGSIPFVVYTGLAHVDVDDATTIVRKPASAKQVVASVQRLLWLSIVSSKHPDNYRPAHLAGEHA